MDSHSVLNDCVSFKIISFDKLEYELKLDKEKLEVYKDSLFFDHSGDINNEIKISIQINAQSVKYVEMWINTGEVPIIENNSIYADTIKLMDYLLLDNYPVEVLTAKHILKNKYGINYEVTGTEERIKINNEILDLLRDKNYACKLNEGIEPQNIFGPHPFNKIDLINDMIKKMTTNQNIISVYDDMPITSRISLHNINEKFVSIMKLIPLPPHYQQPNVYPIISNLNSNGYVTSSPPPPPPSPLQLPPATLSYDQYVNPYIQPVSYVNTPHCIAEFYKYNDYICKVYSHNNTRPIYANATGTITRHWIMRMYKKNDYSIILDPLFDTLLSMELITHMKNNNINLSKIDMERIIMYLKIIKSYEENEEDETDVVDEVNQTFVNEVNDIVELETFVEAY